MPDRLNYRNRPADGEAILKLFKGATLPRGAMKMLQIGAIQTMFIQSIFIVEIVPPPVNPAIERVDSI